MDNQIEITKEMRDSVEVEGAGEAHVVTTFIGVNGDFIRIYDESKNPDSQVVEIEISRDGFGYTNGGVPKTLMMTAADFDLLVELMVKPLKA